MAYSTKFSQPRVGVLGGSIWRQPRWVPADRSTDDCNTANGVDALAFAFNGEYIDYTHVTKADLSRFDVIFANANRIPRIFLQKQLQLLEHLPSSVKWISIIEGNANDYLPPDAEYKQVLDAANLVNVINVHSAPFFRRLTTTPITTIGLPYPVVGASTYTTPYHQRRREICLCPILLKRMNEVMVARELAMPYYGYSQVMLRRLNRMVSNWKNFGSILDKNITIKNTHAAYNDPQLTVYHEKSIVDYFRFNGAAMLWINLDDRYTWGRYVLDAAALRMPIITTESTVHGKTLFPETTIPHHFDLDAAVEIGKRLINDNEFYIHCAENAFAQLQQFSFDAVKQKFLDIFSEL